MRKTKLNQYPKFANPDAKDLNEDQQKVRENVVEYSGEVRRCRTCQIEQPITEYYVTNKVTGRRDLQCRDCQMRLSGVNTIGKYRFSDDLEAKGFRRCVTCEDIKPLHTGFYKSKQCKLGYRHVCKDCARKQLRAWQDKKKAERDAKKTG